MLIILRDPSFLAYSRYAARGFRRTGLGLTVAVLLATPWKSPTLERSCRPIRRLACDPYRGAGPAFGDWFGGGSLSKILSARLLCFFLCLSILSWVSAVLTLAYAIYASLRASRWQVLRYLELPAALPVLFGGLKVGVTLSVIGAVVGEFVGSDRGLGFLVNLARGLFDTPLMFVALFTLMAIALVLYLAVSWLEHWLLKWHWPEESRIESGGARDGYGACGCG